MLSKGFTETIHSEQEYVDRMEREARTYEKQSLTHAKSYSVGSDRHFARQEASDGRCSRFRAAWVSGYPPVSTLYKLCA